MDEMPKKTTADVGHTILKAGLSMIPIVGGSAAELFVAVITPPILKRRDRWIQSLAEHLKLLEEKVAGFKLEDLSSNEQFITASMYATSSAVRNHQPEKLEALRNAVLNVALRNEPDEDLQLIFLNYIDSLTPWHLRILAYFKNPTEWFNQNKIKKLDLEFGGLPDGLYAAYPELKAHGVLIGQLIEDLKSRGLVNTASPMTTMTGHGVFETRTTVLGDRFLKFVTSPINE